MRDTSINTSTNEPVHNANLHFMLNEFNTLMNNDYGISLNNNNNNFLKKNRVIFANKFFNDNYKATLSCISESLGLLTKIYSDSEKLKKEKDNEKKETLRNKLSTLKEEASTKMDKTNKIIINITQSIQNSMIDYPNFNVNTTNLLQIVQYLYELLTTNIKAVIDHSEQIVITIDKIKKRASDKAISREQQLKLIETLSNNLKILTKKKEDLRLKLLILNASIRILTLPPDSLNSGIEIALNTFATRKKRELVKDKHALLAKYIKIIENIRSTNKKTGKTSNLSNMYNGYIREFKELNSKSTTIETQKGLSNLKRLTQKINGALPKGTSLNALSPPKSTKSLNNWENVGSPYTEGIYTPHKFPIKP